MFGAVMRMKEKKENHGRSPTQLRKHEKKSTGLSFGNVHPRYNLDLPARPDVLTYSGGVARNMGVGRGHRSNKSNAGKRVAIIQRMRNNVVQRCYGWQTQSATDPKPVDKVDNTSGKRLVNINNYTEHRDDSNVRLYGTYRELTSAKVKDAHHIIQHAAVREVTGYSKDAAPTIQVVGPAFSKGSEHYYLSYDQKSATIGGTYGAERTIGMNAVQRRLGVSGTDLNILGDYVDRYFCGELKLSTDSATRIPRDRHGVTKG